MTAAKLVMKRNLLENLSKKLRSMTPEVASLHFKMDRWLDLGVDEGDDFPAPVGKIPVTQKTLEACGCAGCAGGWGMTLPSWKKAGIVPEFLGWGWPTFHDGTKQLSGFTALQAGLGLTEAQALYIFAAEQYSVPSDEIRPKMVALHILRVLEGKPLK